MWKCDKCNEENEDNFDACWNCTKDDIEFIKFTKNDKCLKCKKTYNLHELSNHICHECNLVIEKEKKRNHKLNEIILTTETNLNLKIEKRLNILSSEYVIGMNIFKDFFSSVRDLVGGRDKTFQKTLKEAKETVLTDLKQQAYDIGANGVIAIDLDYSEISGGGKSMLFVVASGTAVIINENV